MTINPDTPDAPIASDSPETARDATGVPADAAPLRQTTSPGPAPGKFAVAVREGPGYLMKRVGRAVAAARAAWWRIPARATLARAPRPLRVCLGSGAAPIPGWVNADLERGADVRLDLRFRLPFADGSVELIYSEHVIEHLSLDDGRALLAECRRVLAEDGVLRVATPDLDVLVHSYQHDWRGQDWVNWPCHDWIDSRALMLNVAFRYWGHQHLYDHEELQLRVRQAGFAEVRRCTLGSSSVPELAGLETRPDSLLVIEATGTAPATRA